MQGGAWIDLLGTGWHRRRQYIDSMLSGLLQGQCAVCHAWNRERICAACLRLYVPAQTRCQRCGLSLASGQAICGRCLSEPPPLAATHIAFDYAFPWDALLQRFKFRAGLELQQALAERLLDAVQSAERPDLILPVPLSDKHLRERGYNQAQLLAEPVARGLALPCPNGCLLRVRDSAQQAMLDRAARIKNVKGVFAVDPLRVAELRGRHVAVVDDVMTSGATVFEIGRVLLAAGAASVQAWVLARTPE